MRHKFCCTDGDGRERTRVETAVVCGVGEGKAAEGGKGDSCEGSVT